MVLEWLRRKVADENQRPRRRNSNRPQRLRPCCWGVESLEKRDLPSFSGPTFFPTDHYPTGLAVGDLAGDGHPGIVTGNSGTDTVSVLLGNGDRTFQPPVSYRTYGDGGVFVTLAQLRPGGPLDIISNETDVDNGGLNVYLGAGKGTFAPAAYYSVGELQIPVAVAVGDFTGHGIPDILTMNVSGYRPSTISVLPGRGDGTFGPPISTPAPLDKAYYSVAAGDFTGNGVLDFAAGYNGGVSIFLGNGDGTFQAPVDYPLPGRWIFSVVTQDLSGHGALDLVTADYAADSVSVLPGNGDGTFGPATTYPVGGSYVQTVAVGHFRASGPADLVTANRFSNSVSVLLGNGDGTFGPATTYAVPGPFAVAAVDLTGAGMDDIVATNYSNATVSVLANEGDGPSRAAPPPGPTVSAALPATLLPPHLAPQAVTGQQAMEERALAALPRPEHLDALFADGPVAGRRPLAALARLRALGLGDLDDLGRNVFPGPGEAA